MLVKCGHREFDLDETDRVMFNGACYQIVTKKYYKDWRHHSPVLAKAKAQKMIKEGTLVLHKTQDTLTYYKVKEPNQ